MMNVVNGGVHADNTSTSRSSWSCRSARRASREALRWGAETYHALKTVLHDRGLSTAVGDEGGFAPDLATNEDAIALLVEAIEHAGFTPGEEIAIALDPAIERALPRRRATTSPARARCSVADELVELLDAARRHATRSCRSRTAWPRTTGTAGRALTDGARRPRAARRRRPVRHQRPPAAAWASSAASPTRVLVKVNQIGTLTETLDTVELATRNGYTSVMSHRSGETEDATIADLAVATNCGQIKTGAPARCDRVAKYNQLLRIEADLGESAAYRGRSALNPR